MAYKTKKVSRKHKATRHPAKRKTGSKRSSGRKVGALSREKKDHLTDAAMMLTSGVAALIIKRLGDNANSKATKPIDPKYLFGGELAVGLGLALLVRHPLALGAGVALASASGLQLLQSFDVIKGIDEPRGLLKYNFNPNMGQAKNPYGFPQTANVAGTASKATGVGRVRPMKASTMFAGAGL